MGTSQATAIMGIFGAVQEKRAANEALRILRDAREIAKRRSDELAAQFRPFVEKGEAYLTQAGEMVDASQAYLQEQGALMETGKGLNAADEIAYKDAARLLNEQMVGTGNLRSGAAAFGQTELLRRVVADANQRNFDRQAMKLQLLYGGMAQGANQIGQLGSVSSNIGLQGQALSAQMLQTSLGFAQPEAMGMIRKGQALSNEITSYGVAADEIKDSFREAVSDGANVMSSFGSMMGGAGKMMGGM